MTKPDAKVIVVTETGFHEVLWAYDLGNQIFRIANSPFFAYGISSQDEVVAKPIRHGEWNIFVGIHRKSGNRTIRLAGDKRITRGGISEKTLNDLEGLGCTHEGKSSRYKSINIPPNVDIAKVEKYLLRTNQLWEYVDPVVEQVKGRQAKPESRATAGSAVNERRKK